MRKLSDLISNKAAVQAPLKDDAPREFARESAAELGALERDFRQRAHADQKRFSLTTDTEFWACLCFQTREQREAFFAGLNMPSDSKYVDGRKIANALNIALPDNPKWQTKTRRLSKLPTSTI